MVHVLRMHTPLGPCPVCSGTPKFYYPLFQRAYMRCEGCGARGPTVDFTYYNAMVNHAEAAWNRMVGFVPPPRRRPPPPGPSRAPVAAHHMETS